MSEQRFEVEIKSLLGDRPSAEEFKQKLLGSPYRTELVGKSEQLNHYFVGGDMKKIFEKVVSHVPVNYRKRLERVLTEGVNHSIRTRQKDDRVYFVVKAAIDGTGSENGIARMEFEEEVDLTLEELDKILLDAGCEYQAKWSRQREEYTCGDNVRVCIDRNAGYGYLAEFERVVGEDEDIEEVKKQLRKLMKEFDLEELPADRLQRMFEYYNKNWPKYYGTNKTFVVE